LDAHKKSIAVAMLLPDQAGAIQWEVVNSESELRRLAKRLKRQASGEIRSCYEAGPTGYGLQRILEAEGIVCEVVAPSLIPVKPGERIKTDRRDARKLAELLRASLLTEVRAPTPEEESIRDLCRCREDAKEEQTRARHRLTKFLLRRALIYGPGKAWTLMHKRWLESLRFDREADRLVFGDYLRALELVEERLKALDAALEDFSTKEPYAAPVGWLRCHHGINTLSAMMLIAELYNIRRFESARALMACLGLVPSEAGLPPEGDRDLQALPQPAEGQHRALRGRENRHAGARAPSPVAAGRAKCSARYARSGLRQISLLSRMGVAERDPRQQIHVVWDNLNIHFDGAERRWTRFNQRSRGRFHFHYTVSGPDTDEIAHAKFTAMGADVWGSASHA
jgi:transposase